jgi:hypothetical protein
MHRSHATKRARSARAASKSRRTNRAVKWAGLALAAAAPVMGAGAVASPALATPQGSSHYQFRTINNNADPTFNQLLGINKTGVIAGYFGSGAAGHPNKGYLLTGAGQGSVKFQNENWPESIQTQVTGLNDHGVTVGFWSTMNTASGMNDNRGFVLYHGLFVDGDFPTANPASPPVDQLLGVNDNNVAVGFYNDGDGNTHAYKFNIGRNQFSEITPAGISNPTAAGINNNGDVAGFGTNSAGQVVGFLLRSNGQVTALNVPGSSQTQALGINDEREVVGVYQVGTGDNAVMHGFTWMPQHGFRTVDDPNGVGATTINGVNDQGQLVGFYTDANGNTDGMLATPASMQHGH